MWCFWLGEKVEHKKSEDKVDGFGDRRQKRWYGSDRLRSTKAEAKSRLAGASGRGG